jgi:hypothetical protein
MASAPSIRISQTKKEERIRIGKLARESVNKYTSDKVGSEWISLIEESGVYE